MLWRPPTGPRRRKVSKEKREFCFSSFFLRERERDERWRRDTKKPDSFLSSPLIPSLPLLSNMNNNNENNTPKATASCGTGA